MDDTTNAHFGMPPNASEITHRHFVSNEFFTSIILAGH